MKDIKVGDTVEFTKEAIEFGIGSQENFGQVINIRNKARGKLAKVKFENGVIIEINTAWIKIRGMK